MIANIMRRFPRPIQFVVVVLFFAVVIGLFGAGFVFIESLIGAEVIFVGILGIIWLFIIGLGLTRAYNDFEGWR